MIIEGWLPGRRGFGLGQFRMFNAGSSLSEFRRCRPSAEVGFRSSTINRSQFGGEHAIRDPVRGAVSVCFRYAHWNGAGRLVWFMHDADGNSWQLLIFGKPRI